MARIDAFIDLLVREAADCLVFETGGGAALHSEGAPPRPLLQQTLTAAQIAGALGEVLPGEARSTPPRPGTRFLYESPSGPMKVSCEAGPGGLRVVVRPEVAAEEPLELDTPGADRSAFAPPGHIGANDDGIELDAGDAELEVDDGTPTPPSGTPVLVRSAAQGPHARGTLEALISEALAIGASDVHLTSGTPPAVRVGGSLQTLQTWGPTDTDRLVVPALPPPARDELLRTRSTVQVLRTAAGRVRVHLFAEARGTAAALRVVLPAIPAAQDLGLPAQALQLLAEERGLFLVCGAASSGRTTTLASLIEAASELRGDHLVVVQQTMEFVHGGRGALVRQREVPTHVPTMAEGIRQAMGGDADVIAVDELRDPESCALALEAADRGHLVLATFAATSAQAAIERMLQHGAPLLAGALRCATAQTLCARGDGGRVPAFEVALGGGAVAAAIREGKTFQLPSIQQASRALGMSTQNDALLELVRRHAIEPREALARSSARAELRAALERAGVPLQ